MALQQCSNFLNEMRQKGVKVVDAVDTALSARMISEGRQYGSGAIASSSAAEIYSLSVLKQEIEDDSLNFTRFLIISGSGTVTGNTDRPAGSGTAETGRQAVSRVMTANTDRPAGTDKAMVCFSLPHKVGSLSQVLSVLAFYQISLTKIQSLPIVGKPWEYMFHIDLIYSDYARYRMALDAIRPLTEGLETIGEFRHGMMPYEPGTN